jgi:PEGA domain
MDDAMFTTTHFSASDLHQNHLPDAVLSSAEKNVTAVPYQRQRPAQTARRHIQRLAGISLLALAALPAIGCVSRRLMVQSNPPGAMVLMEGREIGLTPTGVDFTYYGTRELTLIKDGYETKTQLVPIRAPWYQLPVIEFFADNFLPGRITDRRSVQFDLEPKRMVPNQELLNRGQALRNEAQFAP